MEAATIKLTAADLHQIDKGLASITIVGERAAAGVLSGLDIGNRGIESSKGTHGMSPPPKNKE